MYDLSRDYEHYETVIPLSTKEISGFFDDANAIFFEEESLEDGDGLSIEDKKKEHILGEKNRIILGICFCFLLLCLIIPDAFFYPVGLLVFFIYEDPKYVVGIVIAAICFITMFVRAHMRSKTREDEQTDRENIDTQEM